MFKNEYLPSHAFWLCQHGVKNVYVQSYKFLKRDKWKWGTLNKAILDMITYSKYFEHTQKLTPQIIRSSLILHANIIFILSSLGRTLDLGK